MNQMSNLNKKRGNCITQCVVLFLVKLEVELDVVQILPSLYLGNALVLWRIVKAEVIPSPSVLVSTNYVHRFPDSIV